MPSTHITDLANPTRSGDPEMPTSPPKSQPPLRFTEGAQAPLAGRQPSCRGRAAARRPGRARPAVRALLLAGAVAAMLGLPAVAQAATTSAVRPATTAFVQAPGQAGAPGRAAVPATPAAPSGGVCSVPGIGDIGGLLGFCAQGSSGIIGALNNICQPSVPTPEPATGGIDALISPPGTGTGGTGTHKAPTLYDSYGMAGQSWAAFDLQCSDMASLVGNNIAGVVFGAAKALDRVTITVYQSAAGEGILSWLTGAVNRLVTSLGNAIYFPYLAPVVILGAIWLAWQGLIRRRATRTIEGTLWMVVACAAAIWLIGRPADFTGVGKAVSDGITQALNVAFAKLPAPHQSNCVPLGHADPQSPPQANFNFSSGTSIVDTNANELWTVLVCKPWLDGEFGTTAYTVGKGKPTVVNSYGRQLLWAQAIAANEKPTAGVIQAKQAAYTGLAASLKQKDPGAYALFQGKQWTTRLEIAFAGLFAALLAGVLVLLIAITLILLKLGFLLLLVAGPFFLIVGTHPGFGRVIALRWGELLIGVLLKQAAIAIVLSVLLYAYSLIMGTSDAVLPWALKILMISLVTVAVFIYRKPFTHLFSAVGYGVIGARDRADVQLARAGGTAGRNTLDAATVGVPGFAAYRAARWARRNPAQAAGLAGGRPGRCRGGGTRNVRGSRRGRYRGGGPERPGSRRQPGCRGHREGAGPWRGERRPRPHPAAAGPAVADRRTRAAAAVRLGENRDERPARALPVPGQVAGGNAGPGRWRGDSGTGQPGAGRTPPAIPVRAPSRGASPPQSSPSRAAPPARRAAPPAAPPAAPASHAAPPAAFRGRGTAPAGNGNQADEPAGPAPFWLRPLRRRK